MSGLPGIPPSQRPTVQPLGQQFNTGNNPALLSPDYFKDKEQLTWADDANQRYTREHGIDTEFGGLTGPLGPVPAGLAQQYQAAHDQAVWNARNRMGREALRFAQGGTGLMSSFRAGGGSALLSGQYNNLANVQLQRAQMMQPLDLLGDYRRDALARAGRAGRTESGIGAGLQGLGAVLSVIPGLNIVGAGLLAAGGVVGGIGASKQNASFARAGAGGQQVGGGAGTQGAAFQAALGAARGIGQMAGGYSGTQQPDQYGQVPLSQADRQIAARETGMMEPPPGGFDAPQRFIDDPQSQSFNAQGAGGEPQNKSMGQGGRAGQGAGASMGPPPVVGADGNYEPMAYAAHAAATSPVPEAMQVGLAGNLALQIANDPSWSLITMQIDRELSYRTLGAA